MHNDFLIMGCLYLDTWIRKPPGDLCLFFDIKIEIMSKINVYIDMYIDILI